MAAVVWWLAWRRRRRRRAAPTQAALLVDDGRVQPHLRRVPNSICINQPRTWVLKRAGVLAGAGCWVEEAASLSGRCIPSKATGRIKQQWVNC